MTMSVQAHTGMAAPSRDAHPCLPVNRAHGGRGYTSTSCGRRPSGRRTSRWSWPSGRRVAWRSWPSTRCRSGRSAWRGGRRPPGRPWPPACRGRGRAWRPSARPRPPAWRRAAPARPRPPARRGPSATRTGPRRAPPWPPACRPRPPVWPRRARVRRLPRAGAVPSRPVPSVASPWHPSRPWVPVRGSLPHPPRLRRVRLPRYPDGNDSTVQEGKLEVRALCRSSDGWDEVDDLDKVLELRRDPARLVWAEADVSGTQPEDVRSLAEGFDLDPLAVEDAVQPRQRPKVEPYPGHLLVILYQLDEVEDQLEPRQMAAFVGAGFVMVLHHGAA